MKKYPRISRLSTVNLIYHQDYDYDFHQIRTDFTGDSGVGKSLIADILQLILVGSKFFKSATQSDGERPVRTMVFQKANKEIDVGYAFLNIEITFQKFIVIGVYIKNNETQAKNFIIQNGDNFEENGNIMPFKTMLSCKDFTKDNAPLYIDDLKKELLQHKELDLELFESHVKYFKILSHNSLIPLEISKYEDAVKIYTEIIRTFARGHKIKFGKDHELKRFLFGDEGRETIKSKFERAKSELEKNISDYKFTSEVIDDIAKKLFDLEELLQKKREKDEAYIKWIKANIGFCKYQNNVAQKLFEEKTSEMMGNLQNLNKLKEFLAEKGKFFQQENERLFQLITNSSEIQNQHKKIQNVKKWLNNYDFDDVEQLRHRFNNHKQNRQRQNQIKKLDTILTGKQVLKSFQESKWIEGYNVGLDWNRQEILEIKEQLAHKKALESFSDLNNENSLGYWAVNRNKPFSIEQESILMYFQKLSISTQKPILVKEKGRFLPNPSAFFEIIVPKQEDENGFWIDLGGVYEYIKYVEEQKLSGENYPKIKEIISQLYKLIKTDIANLDSKLKSLNHLFEATTTIPPEQVNAYIYREEIKGFDFNTQFDTVSEEEFNESLRVYAEKERIEIAFDAFKKISASSSENAANLTQTKILLGLIEPKLKNETEFKLIWERNNYKEEKKYNETLDYGRTHTEWLSFYDSIKTITIERYKEIEEDKNAKYKKLKEEGDKIKDNTSFDIDKIEFYKTDPNQLNVSSISKAAAYQSNYELLVKEHLNKNRGLRFIDENLDFIKLSKELLPSIIKNEDILTDDRIIGQIKAELNLINGKSRAFTKDKASDLKEILDDLSEIIDDYRKSYKKIKAFFRTQKENKKLISNEFEVKFSWNDGEINQKWILDFAKKQPTLDTLFSDNSLQDLITGKKTFEEFTETVFENLSENGQKQDINKILDPNSYFRLEFKLNKEDGWNNAGISTGQNYAAVALLCIARLSIIEKQTKAGKQVEGIRFMPIDEAEGLGSNFDLLYDIAQEQDYQIVTMSIGTLDILEEGMQTIYILHRNMEETKRPINYPPEKISSTLIEDNYDTNEVETLESFE